MASPASRRATNCSLSSITEHSFQGITPSQKTGGSVTHVSGTMCYLCLRPLKTKELTLENRSLLPPTVATFAVFFLHSNMNLSRFARQTAYAHYTLIARINSGDGKFPYVNV